MEHAELTSNCLIIIGRSYWVEGTYDCKNNRRETGIIFERVAREIEGDNFKKKTF